MGMYLSSPDKTKHKDAGSSPLGLEWGACGMQGWRMGMEDAHLAATNVGTINGKSISVFGVFDGHGGSEVSTYVAEIFVATLLSAEAYKAGNIVDALKETFLALDAKVLSPEGQTRLTQLAADPDVDPNPNPNPNPNPTLDLVEELESSPTLKLSRALLQAMKKKYMDSDGNENEDEEKDDPNPDPNPNPNPKSKRSSDRSKKAKKDETADTSHSQTSRSSRSSRSSKKVVDEVDHVETMEPERSKGKGKRSQKAESGKIPVKKSRKEKKEEEEEEDEDEDYVDEEDDEDDDEDEDGYMMQPSGPGYDSGTTACVCVFVGMESIVVANAGDSRCVLSRGGEAVTMSHDHNPNNEGEHARIIKAGGFVSEDGRVDGNLNLSRAIGDHRYKLEEHLGPADQRITCVPEVITSVVSPSDEFIVVACDGIWNVMSNEQAVNFMREGLGLSSTNAPPAQLLGRRAKAVAMQTEPQPIADVCANLCEACCADNTEGDGTGCDNMTVLCVRIPRMAEDLSSPRILRPRVAT